MAVDGGRAAAVHAAGIVAQVLAGIVTAVLCVVLFVFVLETSYEVSVKRTVNVGATKADVTATLGTPVEEGAPPAIRREPHPVDADAVQYFMKKPHYGIPHIGVVTVYYSRGRVVGVGFRASD